MTIELFEGAIGKMRCGGRTPPLILEDEDYFFTDLCGARIHYSNNGSFFGEGKESIFDIVEILNEHERPQPKPKTLKEMLDNNELEDGMMFCRESYTNIEIVKTRLGIFTKQIDSSYSLITICAMSPSVLEKWTLKAFIPKTELGKKLMEKRNEYIANGGVMIDDPDLQH